MSNMVLGVSYQTGDFFKWWGDESTQAANWIKGITVRSTTNFNWTFIFILAVVFFIYGYQIYKKNWDLVKAGFALYGVHWLYEIMNAIICTASGYPLWGVSNNSTTFILLVGVSWELSMMFSLAGMITFMMLPKDRTTRWFKFGKFKGIPCKLVVSIGMALFFALFESFLAGTNGGATFIWYYKWWGVLLVFITTYVPFFLAACYLPDIRINAFAKLHKTNIIKAQRSYEHSPRYVIGGIWVLVVILLAVLIPCGVI